MKAIELYNGWRIGGNVGGDDDDVAGFDCMVKDEYFGSWSSFRFRVFICLEERLLKKS